MEHSPTCGTGKWYYMNEAWKQYVKQKNLGTKGHVLYDSIYVKCLE